MNPTMLCEPTLVLGLSRNIELHHLDLVKFTDCTYMVLLLYQTLKKKKKITVADIRNFFLLNIMFAMVTYFNSIIGQDQKSQKQSIGFKVWTEITVTYNLTVSSLSLCGIYHKLGKSLTLLFTIIQMMNSHYFSLCLFREGVAG